MKHCVYLQSTQTAHDLMVSVKGCDQVLILLSSFLFFFPCRQLKRDHPSAVVLSTDDFFVENGVYIFEPDFLEDAHKWNQKRGDQTRSRGCAVLHFRLSLNLAPQMKYLKVVFTIQFTEHWLK